MRSIFAKIFLAHLLTLLVALATLSVLLSSSFHSLYMNLASRDLYLRAQQMATELDLFLAEPRTSKELRQYIRVMQVSSHTSICFLAHDADSRLVGQGPPGDLADQKGPLASQAEPGAASVYPAGVIPCGEATLLAPVVLPQHGGSLFVRASVATTVDATVKRLRRLLLYAGLVAAALSLLVALGLSERISGPLRRMRLLAGQMAKGDFSRRLEMRPSDEVGALAGSFDSLADSLQTTLRQLEQEQARLRGILASVAEGIIAVDAEGRVTLLNPQAAAQLDVDQSGARGSAVEDLSLPQTVSRQFTECLRTNRLCTAEFELSHPQRHLVLQVAPLRAAEGDRWGAVGVLRDVTASHRLETMRRRFISDASHEIRTPLTAIGGFAAAIADGTAATPEQRTRSASFVVREVERLSRLVGDLLDLSRIESGAVKLEMEEVDLSQLIHAAVEAFDAQTREKRIRVELELARDLPTVRADPDRIYQVLVNLISNALRFNRPDGTISIVAREIDAHLQVEVHDTGPGIPAEQLPHIWERFHRADSSRARGEGGTGLGLAIVRSIIEAHEGTVSAQSELGEGSTFSFSLPIT